MPTGSQKQSGNYTPALTEQEVYAWLLILKKASAKSTERRDAYGLCNCFFSLSSLFQVFSTSSKRSL